jgi:hypothetical protein
MAPFGMTKVEEDMIAKSKERMGKVRITTMLRVWGWGWGKQGSVCRWEKEGWLLNCIDDKQIISKQKNKRREKGHEVEQKASKKGENDYII